MVSFADTGAKERGPDLGASLMKVGADEQDLYGVYGVGERKAIGEGARERAKTQERESGRAGERFDQAQTLSYVEGG